MLSAHSTVCISELRAPFGDDYDRWAAARDRALNGLRWLGYTIRKAYEDGCSVYVCEVEDVSIASMMRQRSDVRERS